METSRTVQTLQQLSGVQNHASRFAIDANAFGSQTAELDNVLIRGGNRQKQAGRLHSNCLVECNPHEVEVPANEAKVFSSGRLPRYPTTSSNFVCALWSLTRLVANSQYALLISTPIPILRVSRHATRVVPLPKNGSRTVSPDVLVEHDYDFNGSYDKRGGCAHPRAPSGSA